MTNPRFRAFLPSLVALTFLFALRLCHAQPIYTTGTWPFVAVPLGAWRSTEAVASDAAFAASLLARDAIGLPKSDDGRLVTWTKPSLDPLGFARIGGAAGDSADDKTLYIATHLHNPLPNRQQPFVFSLVCDKRADVYLDGAKLEGAYAANGIWTASRWGSAMRPGASRLVIAVPARGETKFRLDVREPGDLHFFAEPPPGVDRRRPAVTVRTVTLRNERLRAVVAVPDSIRGPGRGYRYEQAGELMSVVCDGHSYVFDAANERDSFDSLQPLAASEEFAPPIAWDDAIPGEPFVKVGVGLFERPFQTEDDSNCPYWLIHRFPWKTRHGVNWVEFTQVVDGPRRWAYLYTKRIVLVPHTSEIKIEHYFVNIGRQPITTEQCCHMQVQLDAIKQGYSIKLPFNVKFSGNRPANLGLAGGTLGFPAAPVAYAPLTGYSEQSSDNAAVISSIGTTARVIIGGDFPLSMAAVHSSGTGVCYDQVANVDVKPGEDAKWTRTITLATGAAGR